MAATTRKRKARYESAQSKGSEHCTRRDSIIEISDSDEEVRAFSENSCMAKGKQRQIVNSCQEYDTIEIEDDDITAGDEALARRLAEEWRAEDEEVLINQHKAEKNIDSLMFKQERGNIMLDEFNSPDKELLRFREVFAGKKACSKCGQRINPPSGNVVFSPGDHNLPPSIGALLHASCTSCKSNHCRGCWSPTRCKVSCNGIQDDCLLATCCASGRAIAIFELLGGLDRHIIQERTTSTQGILTPRKASKRKRSSYAQPGSIIGPNSTSNKAVTNSTHFSDGDPTVNGDTVIIRAFDILTRLLPAPYSESPRDYDLIPHKSIGMLVSLSTLPELLTSLLRNDSVSEWTTRSELYFATLRLLQRMADCELTARVLIEPRWEVATTPGLAKWMQGKGTISWRTDDAGTIERGAPLFENFKRLIKQSETFMTTVSNSMDGYTTEEERDITTLSLSLCGDFITAGDHMAHVIEIMGVSPSKSDKSKKEETSTTSREKAYMEACEALAFRYVPFASPGSTVAKYQFSSKLRDTENSTRVPKNHFRIASELATMATSLPSGAWVRVDEVRMDAIKIMIAGPEGTPYEGGLFEFDCFLPLEYPNVPPKVKICTTGGGKVRFNPNLYACGNVCLSLLGTWHGRPEEMWGAKSTLLQVIVSIQSMILINTPWFNEPGRGTSNSNNPSSISYNRSISLNTARYAILDWLQLQHLEGIWGEVIMSHFEIKKDVIRQRIVQWINDYNSHSKTNRNYFHENKIVPTHNMVREYDERIQLISKLART